MNPTRIGILIFAAAALAGPFYAVDGYSTVGNVISQLGAQQTQNNVVMVTGFLALGLGIMADGFRRFTIPLLPFIAFGLFMALAGIFAHKPLSTTVEYSAFAHQAHSMLATLAGISITIGLLWFAVLRPKLRTRATASTLAVLCFVLPICMLGFPDFQGLIQRLMYVLILAWLWIHFPFKKSLDEHNR